MTAIRSESELTAQRVRYGAVLLGASIALSLVSVSTYVFGASPPDPSASVQERANAISESAGAFRVSGYVGVFADVVGALAAFLLVGRALRTRTNVPVSSAWFVMAIAMLVFTVADGLAATALVPTADGAARGSVPFLAVEAATNFAFALGAMLAGAAALVLLWGESRADHAAIPAWACYAGMVGGGASILFGFGTMMGIMWLGVTILGIYLMLLAFLFLAIRIVWPHAFDNLMPAKAAHTAHH